MLRGGKAPWLGLSTGFEISKIGQELTKLQSFQCLKSTNLKKRKKIETRLKNYNFANFYPIFKISNPAESWQQSAYFGGYVIFVYLAWLCHFQTFLS
jgi:hypothetical protein